ncbi:MAG: helix-turn-helix transcriptional regulator [Lachnospirales bacterium]
MRSFELKVTAKSDYFLYTPSTLAKKIYFYPIYCGHFYYEPHYFIKRNSYDSFLLMLVKNGECHGTINNKKFNAKKNQLVLIDCYKQHEYGSPASWEALWIHFDGPLAKTYFKLIFDNYGHVFTPTNLKDINTSMENIISLFRNPNSIKEDYLSFEIVNILNSLLNIPNFSQDFTNNYSVIQKIKSYINENFNKPLNLETLAKEASLSQFHFIRVFTKVTGFTPHKYLIETRITAAKYLLKSSETSIKDIAFSCGFNSESSFCSAFKKSENITPSQYRTHVSC